MLRKIYYDTMYSEKEEPWNYNRRAAEQLRYIEILSILERCCSDKKTLHILDIGCGIGHLTKRLLKYSKHVFAIDISDVAISKLKKQCVMEGVNIEARTALSTDIPFEDNYFDIVILSDGISEWQLSNNEIKKTLSEVNRVAKNGGIAIFTDYLKPNQFKNWIKSISDGPLKITEVRYFYDRLWYQFECLFKKIRHWKYVQKILASMMIATLLRIPARLLGQYGSRHILAVLKKCN